MRARQVRTTKQAHAGFTLIEVVVALAILALAAGVIYQSLGWSLRRTDTLRRREVAWLVAQSTLAQVRARPSAQPRTERGEMPDGLRWEVRIDAYKTQVDERNPIQPFEVIVTVSWGPRPGQQVALRSIETLRKVL